MQPSKGNYHITYALVTGMTGGRQDYGVIRDVRPMDKVSTYALGTSFTVNLN